jgi:glycosyltransferase involved in cell wall biosynthesis
MNGITNVAIDAFVLYSDEKTTLVTLKQLKEEPLIGEIYVMMQGKESCPYMGCEVIRVDDFRSSSTVRKIAEKLKASFALLCTAQTPITFGYQAISRMCSVANSVDPALVYADRYVVKNGETVKSPTMDFYYGSVRDDFDFGPVMLFSAPTLQKYVEEFPDADYTYSGLYDLQLFSLRRKRQAALFHIREFLYTEEEKDLRTSGEKQFDYVNPRNREVQKEREIVCTKHLKLIGSYIEPESIVDVAVERYDFDREASVIIPVRNRVKTIEDAIRSALAQRTTFQFNVMVVDNLSTDGTTEVIQKVAAEDSRVVHIIPTRKDLGIGGCWSLAFNDTRCGRFAIQLDSDDLYSGTDTLQRIVDKFYEEHCAMVIGSYRMCNFQLETLPPGLIDHREWTPENGHNNALRINGLGAPRAFFTPLLRKIGMPNTSYGEDYAVGLAFCRKYKIGRIYDELYLCRRWEGNSDASLTPEQVNRNNVYKDSLRTMEIINRRRLNDYWQSAVTDGLANKLYDEQLPMWKEAQERYEKLANVVTAEMETNGCKLVAQYNPARIVSTGAKVDAESIKQRPCFLCEVNRPAEQISSPLLKKYYLLLNPNPILPKHFTIPLRHHRKQQIFDYYEDMMEITSQLKEMFVFYNGPKCGASAPDHMHFQAGSRGVVPLERDWNKLYKPNLSRIWPISEEEYLEAVKMDMVADSTGVFSLRNYLCPGIVIITRTPHANKVLFEKVYRSLPINEDEYEPMMNIMAWSQSNAADGYERIVSVILPRTKHRPDCYFKEGKEQVMVSPGSLDMGGMIITPRKEDFDQMNAELAKSIIQECGMSLDAELGMVMKFKSGK